MKLVLPILAILVCVPAAIFSFIQSTKFQDNQDTRQRAIDTNKTVAAKFAKADIEIKNGNKSMEEPKKNIEIATASTQALESEVTRLKNEVAKLDAVLADQGKETQLLQAGFKEVQELFGTLNLGNDVDADMLTKRIGEMDENVKSKRAKLDELEVLIDGARKSFAKKQEEMALLEARKKTHDIRISRNALEARVTAVDTDWGFLVVGAGSNSGFTPQTTLLVKRDGRLIGKVNPSAIEPTQTIAEIDFKSMIPGVRIQPGDSVIIAKPMAN